MLLFSSFHLQTVWAEQEQTNFFFFFFFSFFFFFFFFFFLSTTTTTKHHFTGRNSANEPYSAPMNSTNLARLGRIIAQFSHQNLTIAATVKPKSICKFTGSG
ncbi:hypothetical protein CRV24_006139 [Beauveria bassiana]|nr:hypothetical protein CRV24_006139 [Beauveria bassiana]